MYRSGRIAHNTIYNTRPNPNEPTVSMANKTRTMVVSILKYAPSPLQTPPNIFSLLFLYREPRGSEEGLSLPAEGRGLNPPAEGWEVEE